MYSWWIHRVERVRSRSAAVELTTHRVFDLTRKKHLNRQHHAMLESANQGLATSLNYFLYAPASSPRVSHKSPTRISRERPTLRSQLSELPIILRRFKLISGEMLNYLATKIIKNFKPYSKDTTALLLIKSMRQ